MRSGSTYMATVKKIDGIKLETGPHCLPFSHLRDSCFMKLNTSALYRSVSICFAVAAMVHGSHFQRQVIAQEGYRLVGIDIVDDTLYEIDKQPVTTSVIGQVGSDGITSLWYDDPTDTLYGVDVSSDQLLKINPNTGASTAVVTFDDPDIYGLFVHPTTRVFYAVKNVANFLSDTDTDRLVTFDPVTGAVSDVGETGLRSVGGLAYDEERDTLYTVETSFSRNLFTIDTATGATDRIGNIGSDFTGPSGLVFDRSTDSLIGIDRERLIRINTTTGDASRIGSLPFTTAIRSLAFVSSVPEPSTFPLAIFLTFGVARKRRHRVA